MVQKQSGVEKQNLIIEVDGNLIKDIDDYIKKGNPLKYAGSYTLNDIADKFIEKIVGDPLNIIGFPVDTIMETLKEFGIKKL